MERLGRESAPHNVDIKEILLHIAHPNPWHDCLPLLWSFVATLGAGGMAAALLRAWL